MKPCPHLKKVVLGLGMAGFAILTGQVLAGAWGLPTMGDSALPEGWGTTVQANALDPDGLGPMTPDPNGLGPYRVPVAHTPSGQLYSVPWKDPDSPNTQTGSVEIGAIYTRGDNGRGAGGSNKFNEYGDTSNGVFINHFNFSSDSGTTHLDTSGGGVGRTDQYYNLQFGEDNDWKVRGSFDEDDHVNTGKAR